MIRVTFAGHKFRNASAIVQHKYTPTTKIMQLTRWLVALKITMASDFNAGNRGSRGACKGRSGPGRISNM